MNFNEALGAWARPLPPELRKVVGEVTDYQFIEGIEADIAVACFPFQPFNVGIARDVVLKSRHPEAKGVELAFLEIPDGFDGRGHTKAVEIAVVCATADPRA